MLKRTKLLLTALLAIAVCSLAAGSASASRSIEVRGQVRSEVEAEGRLTFLGTEGERGREITCELILVRTIANVIPKIRGTLFGKVILIIINRGGTTRSPNCTHGSSIREVHDILPLNCTHSETGTGILIWDCKRAPAGLWKLIYLSFQGTLPSIDGINFHIQGVQFRLLLLEPFGGTQECLYEGNAFGLIEIARETGVISRARAVRELTGLTRIRGGILCPARGTFSGEFRVRPNLTIRLI
jgi:hypothetical protein